MKHIVTLVSAMLFISLPTAVFAKQKIKVITPENAPKIISDFKSLKGANGKLRSSRHQGIDILVPNGMPIISVANGIVLDTDIGKCWGPTLTVDHGLGFDGKRLIVVYGHLDRFTVSKGQKIRRGQIVGHLGNSYQKYKCTAGVRHLHLQIGRKALLENRGKRWGHVRYLKDGKRGVNPHLYWADGAGRITCFEKGKKYPAGTITYPVYCN